MLFTNVEFHQFLKLPVLVKHFHEHKQEDPSISFWAFIKMHYNGKVVIDDDYQRDQQLPLRDATTCQLLVSTVFECHQVSYEIIIPAENTKVFLPYQEKNNSHSASFDIFQPPRFV